MRERLKVWARALKRDIAAIARAAHDPRLPWPVKLAAVAAYALSPIDLIPDFVPVLGYLDDLLIVPLGIWLVLRSIPPEILAEHRAATAGRPARSLVGAAMIVTLWVALAVWVAHLFRG